MSSPAQKVVLGRLEERASPAENTESASVALAASQESGLLAVLLDISASLKRLEAHVTANNSSLAPAEVTPRDNQDRDPQKAQDSDADSSVDASVTFYTTYLS